MNAANNAVVSSTKGIYAFNQFFGRGFGMRKYFGTDGIRGKVGTFPVTPDFMLKLGYAVGSVFSRFGQEENTKILIGKDTRISGYMFEAALEAGLSAAGVHVRLLGPMPTPGIAYLTRTFRAQAGIVISASHNPYYDNGIKFFSSEGRKLPDEIELQIEAQLEKEISVVDGAKLGKAKRIEDAAGRYIEFCKAVFLRGLSLKGLRIVLDSANGAAYNIAPRVFEELGATVISMSDTPDGLNINLNCGSTYPKVLQQGVLKHQADLGIAFDGDGDRVILVDAKGQVIDGDQILYVLALGRKRAGTLSGGVIGTVMTNLGLEVAFKKSNIPFLRTKVGDRYVMEALEEQKWQLGGESSGHIICLDKTTTGDGIIAALEVLSIMVSEQVSLADLLSGLQVFPQVLLNTKLPRAVTSDEFRKFEGTADVQKSISIIQEKLKDSGRILIRPSGTEPLVRVMVEGEDAALTKSAAEALSVIVKNYFQS